MTSQFEEAIYIASLDLWNDLQKHSINNPKVKQSLLKYWIRSCTRCTPFGGFAGTSVLNLAPITDLKMGNVENHISKVRIDMNFVTAIKNSIHADKSVRNSLLFYPNETLYESPYDYRYVEHAFKYGYMQYTLSSLEKSNYISELLNISSRGKDIPALVEALVNMEDVAQEEALQFIEQLIEAQIIISDLEIKITGEDPMRQLINCLAQYPEATKYRSMLIEIDELLNSKVSNDANYYENIIDKIKAFHLPNPDFRNVFQLDTFIPLEKNLISEEVVNEIVSQLRSLLKFASPRYNIHLENFKAAFIQKFEDAEVSLAIALDADLGVGYGDVTESSIGGSGWVDDFIINQTQSTSKQLNYIQQWIISKYHNFLNSQDNFIEITEADVNALQVISNDVTFPDGMFLMGALLKQNNLFDSKNFLFDLHIIGGPSAANLMARFAHGNHVISEHIKTIIKSEESTYPDVVFAEIVHLPQARVGNILIRPCIRQYEIPYLGTSGASKDNQLSIHDLMVSVQNNEVVLRSARLNKRIIPRLTTAHNYTNRSLPLYHFLCDVQNQGMDNPNFWDWGNLSTNQYLPRVTYKNIVISKAKWNLQLSDLQNMPENHDDIITYFNHLRVKFNIPKKVQYVDYDNRLLIDFENKPSVIILLGLLKKSKYIILEEFLFDEQNCIISNDLDEPFVNEIIIPIKNNSTLINSYKKTTKVLKTPTKYMPDSEWLYYKLYAGVKTQEKLLTNYVLPLLEEEGLKNSFECFFFIRYQDDRPHLRLRFKNSDLGKQKALRQKVSEMINLLHHNKYVDRVVNDTYVPEVNRYGGSLIHESEQIFYEDSLAILRLLSLFDEEDSEYYKLLIGMRSIETYLDDFAMSTQAKFEFIRKMADSYFAEHGGSNDLRVQLNRKYKMHQKKIFSIMDCKNDVENDLEEAIEILKERSKSCILPIRIMQKNLDFRTNKNFTIEIISSIIHMSVNRLFVGKQRRYELLLYTFLERYYSSLMARALKTQK